jgi:hypothetical protein
VGPYYPIKLGVETPAVKQQIEEVLSPSRVKCNLYLLATILEQIIHFVSFAAAAIWLAATIATSGLL